MRDMQSATYKWPHFFNTQENGMVLLKWFLTLNCTMTLSDLIVQDGGEMRPGPYSEDLKQEIIHLNLKERRSIKSLSREYGISTSTISRWLTVYRNQIVREATRENIPV